MQAPDQANREDDEALTTGRRDLLKAMAAGGSWVMARALLPAVWSAPVVASMALPEHAQASCRNVVDVDPPMGSVELEAADGIEFPSKGPLISGDWSFELRVRPPALLQQSRTQFQVYERSEARDGTAYVCVVALFTPSDDPTFSTDYRITLTRSPGNYEYQLRWAGGHTAWRGVSFPRQ